MYKRSHVTVSRATWSFGCRQSCIIMVYTVLYTKSEYVVVNLTIIQLPRKYCRISKIGTKQNTYG